MLREKEAGSCCYLIVEEASLDVIQQPHCTRQRLVMQAPCGAPSSSVSRNSTRRNTRCERQVAQLTDLPTPASYAPVEPDSEEFNACR